jgi:hypothetical protein
MGKRAKRRSSVRGKEAEQDVRKNLPETKDCESDSTVDFPNMVSEENDASIVQTLQMVMQQLQRRLDIRRRPTETGLYQATDSNGDTLNVGGDPSSDLADAAIHQEITENFSRRRMVDDVGESSSGSRRSCAV